MKVKRIFLLLFILSTSINAQSFKQSYKAIVEAKISDSLKIKQFEALIKTQHIPENELEVAEAYHEFSKKIRKTYLKKAIY